MKELNKVHDDDRCEVIDNALIEMGVGIDLLDTMFDEYFETIAAPEEWATGEIGKIYESLQRKFTAARLIIGNAYADVDLIVNGIVNKYGERLLSTKYDAIPRREAQNVKA